MPASSATRRGRGAGHGGPRAGEGWGGPANGKAEPVPLDQVRHLRWDPENLARKAEVEAEMLGVLYAIAHDGDAEAVRVNAADKMLDRLQGKPVQRQDHTSKGERIGYVIPAPPEAEDAETWMERHKPR